MLFVSAKENHWGKRKTAMLASIFSHRLLDGLKVALVEPTAR